MATLIESNALIHKIANSEMGLDWRRCASSANIAHEPSMARLQFKQTSCLLVAGLLYGILSASAFLTKSQKITCPVRCPIYGIKMSVHINE